MKTDQFPLLGKNEVITYLYHNVIYVESFQAAWYRLSKIFDIKKEAEHEKLILSDVKIFGNTAFHDWNYFIKKPNEHWNLYFFTGGYFIKTSGDLTIFQKKKNTSVPKIIIPEEQENQEGIFNSTIKLQSKHHCFESITLPNEKAYEYGKEKLFPDEIFMWNREAKIHYIIGILKTSNIKEYMDHTCVCFICFENKELALKIKHLLLSMQYPAKIFIRSISGQKIYELEFSPSKEILSLIPEYKNKFIHFIQNNSFYFRNDVSIFNLTEECNLENGYQVGSKNRYIGVNGILCKSLM